MDDLAALAIRDEDLEVRFEVLLPYDTDTVSDERRKVILAEMQDIDGMLAECQKQVDKLNSRIDSLTNQADQLDYAVAVASGVLTGLIDSFFVGEVDLVKAREWGGDQVNRVVQFVGGDKDVEKAVKKLEDLTKKYFPSDANLNDYGGGLQHHFRDFAHHPTPVGLAFSLLTQFTGNCYGTDTNGVFLVVPVKDPSRIGDTVPQKILYGTWYWFLHLVSDMAGSHDFAGAGTGLPGPLLSLAKELSALRIFKNAKIGDMEFSQFLSKIYNGTLFAEHDEAGKIIKGTEKRVDMRTGLGMLQQQMLPVILNETFVRVFYSARRLCMELRENEVHSFSDLQELNWRKIASVGNRTLTRMVTIASGTFMAVDLADAAIRSGIESVAGGAAAPVLFVKGMILRVNFVGVGRFALAVVTDCRMESKLQREQNERVLLYSKMVSLTEAKMLYKDADAWISAKDAGEIIARTYALVSESARYFGECWFEIQHDLSRLPATGEIEKHNPGLIQDLLDILDE